MINRKQLLQEKGDTNSRREFAKQVSNKQPLDCAVVNELFASDMNHSNMYAVGLVLRSFVKIALEETSSESNEIKQPLESSNTYIWKKACSPSAAAIDSWGGVSDSTTFTRETKTVHTWSTG